MKPVLLLLFLLLEAVAVAARAEQAQDPEVSLPAVRESAADLLKSCTATSLTPRGRLRLRYCYGYLAGTEETMRLLLQESHALCPPPGITIRELARIFVLHVNARPEMSELPAAEAVARSLRHRYPCGR